MIKNNNKKTCCGTTHIGERGQVVIPADVRKEMNLETGDKLITFSKDEKVLIMMKAEEVEKMLGRMTKKVKELKKTLGK